MVSLKPTSLPAIAATLAFLFVPSLAHADSAYQLVFDQGAYQVDPGAQLSVNVYLQEQVSGGSASVLATDGLISAGLRVSFDLSPLPSDPAKILSDSDVTPNDGPARSPAGSRASS